MRILTLFTLLALTATVYAQQDMEYPMVVPEMDAGGQTVALDGFTLPVRLSRKPAWGEDTLVYLLDYISSSTSAYTQWNAFTYNSRGLVNRFYWYHSFYVEVNCGYDAYTYTWFDSVASITTYDAWSNGQPSMQMLDTAGEFVNSWTMTYDAYNHLSGEFFETDYWMKYRYLYYNLPSGKIRMATRQDYDNSYYDYYRYKWYYDDAENDTLECYWYTYETWQGIQYVSKTWSQFNDHNQRIASQSYWLDQQDTSVLTLSDIYSYEYYSSGKLKREYRESYNGTVDTNITDIRYCRNALGLLDTTFIISRHNGDHILTRKIVREYNGPDNQISEIRTKVLDGDNPDWIYVNKEIFEYDSAGNMVHNVRWNAQGTYLIKVSDAYFHYSLHTVVGLNEVFENYDHLRIYPNPVTRVLHIVGASSRTGQVNYTILDVSGREIMAGAVAVEDMIRLDVSGLTHGMYVLKLTDEDGHTRCRKFLRSDLH